MHIKARWIREWQEGNMLFAVLRPLALLFRMITSLRRVYYRIFSKQPLAVPVLIVGNINVGGSGKTPVVVALVDALRASGFHPGIISRGYRGSLNQNPVQVHSKHEASQVGDEPLFMHEATGAPVVIGRNRYHAAKLLMKVAPKVDVILSDDGLQHYGLPRFKEIVIVDKSILANARMLPEGPLREPLSRLKDVDYLLSADKNLTPYPLDYSIERISILHEPGKALRLEDCAGKTVHAVAGIARPERFFNSLRALNIKVIEHPFEDHHVFSEKDFLGFEHETIFITEKDAIKCQNIKAPLWVVKMKTTLDARFVKSLVKDLHDGQKTA